MKAGYPEKKPDRILVVFFCNTGIYTREYIQCIEKGKNNNALQLQ